MADHDHVPFGHYLYEKGYVAVQTIALALARQATEGGVRKIGAILLEDFKVFKSQADLDHVFAEYERDIVRDAAKHGEVVFPRKPLEDVLADVLRDLDYYDISRLNTVLKSIEALRAQIVAHHGLA